jgi:ribonuclease BN (tRNA processing enzyme)
LNVRFWGTRGSIAKPGPSTARYGGNTSCIEVRSSRGTLIVIDCGTGAHGLGGSLLAEGVKRGCLLIGHTHWDHIQGIPFFAPLFDPTNEWDICGPKGLSGSLRETLAGQMESTYFPVALESLGATIRYWDLLQGTFQVDDIRVSTHHLNHPALTLAYRIEADGATVVYACDHEAYSHAAADGTGRLEGPDLRHAEFVAGADLLIHDAQYTAAEYSTKVNWGHSTIEYAMQVAREGNVRQLALTHHDPSRTDGQIDALLASARATMRELGSPIEVFAAAEGLTLEVQPASAPAVAEELFPDSARHRIDTSEIVQTVLLGLFDPDITTLFTDAISADANIRAVTVSNVGDVPTLAAKDRMSAAILEHGPGHDVIPVCQTIAIDRVNERRRMPVLVVTDHEHFGEETPGVDEWLVTPFSSTYAQAKVQAWVHRGASRWRKAAIPQDEEFRLETLRSINLLDTPPDARFDRITRLAGRFFAVPIALITLVDSRRQWFKSCVGLEMRETSRESSFCAHAVFNRKTLVVNDALADDRFAENPLVVDDPRVRFYAGSPLILKDGSCLGALAVLDTRPRWFAASDVQLLEDLRDLAVSEIERERAARGGRRSGQDRRR